MEVVVVGGGVAGAAAALALERAGIGVRVFEARSGAQGAGAFLVVAGNGMRAVRELGVELASGFPLRSARFCNGDGDELGVSALDGHRCVRWDELCTELRAQVRRRGVPVEHGARFVSAEQDGDEVVARFADGRTARGDLLIGADGVHSAVRGQLDPVPERYAGQQVFFGYSGPVDVPHVAGRIEMIRGSAGNFGWTMAPEGRAYWFARIPGPPADPGESEVDRKERLLAALRPDATPAADLVSATEDVLAVNARDLLPQPRWRDGRVLLVGDAAHAASPATGQGASMAFEDAVFLAKSLRDHGNLDVYERFRRARTERNALRSAQMTTAVSAEFAERPDEVDRLSARHTDAPDDDPAALLPWNDPLPAVSPFG